MWKHSHTPSRSRRGNFGPGAYPNNALCGITLAAAMLTIVVAGCDAHGDNARNKAAARKTVRATSPAPVPRQEPEPKLETSPAPVPRQEPEPKLETSPAPVPRQEPEPKLETSPAPVPRQEPEPKLATSPAPVPRQEPEPKPVAVPQRPLAGLPSDKWSDAEKEANQRLFLEKYRDELESAIAEIRRQIDHHTREKIRNEKREQVERRKLAVAEDFIKKAKAAAKAKKFPVEIDGQMLTQKELEMMYLRYNRLIDDRRPVADEFAALKKVAEEQLYKLNRQLPEKLAMLDKSNIYLKRLEAKEHIGRINEVIARIEDSSVSAKVISDSYSDTFAKEEKKVEAIKSQEQEALRSLYE